jgi:hypothetical protein
MGRLWGTRAGSCNGGHHTYISFQDSDGRLQKRPVSVGEIDRLADRSGEEFLLDDRELVSGVFGGREVGFERDAGPVGFLALGHFEVGFEEVLVFASQGDGSHRFVWALGLSEVEFRPGVDSVE